MTEKEKTNILVMLQVKVLLLNASLNKFIAESKEDFEAALTHQKEEIHYQEDFDRFKDHPLYETFK